MKIVVVCAGGTCGKEYGADTDSPFWTCPHCERVTENARYPFLTAKLMQAYVDKDSTDWRAMHDDLLVRAHDVVKDREKVIALKVQEIERLEGVRQGKPAGKRAEGGKPQGRTKRSRRGKGDAPSFFRNEPPVEHDGQEGGDAPGD